MKRKCLTIFASLIFLVLLSIFVPKIYSQPTNSVIYPNEISKTLEEVKEKPSSNETFDRRMKVLEAWAILSVASGKGDELRRITPPEEMQNIMSLKKDGRESEAFKKLDELYLKMEKIGLPIIRSNLGQFQGKCGDGICDDFERANPNLCPQDCKAQETLTKKLSATAAAATANITVDYNKELGAFSPYAFGTVAPPYFNQSGFDKTKEAGFKMIQIPVNVKMPSNPDDPSRYDFTTLDQQVAAAIGNGLEPMILFFTGKKPSDMNKFTTFTKNVVRHLTEGWANGHKWNIRVLRFGNEPDNTGIVDPFGGRTWIGTPQEFFETYAAWAKAMKTINQNFILLTPGLMIGVKGLLEGAQQKNVDSSWVTDFLEYAKKNNVPIDMFSAHGYGPVIYYSGYEKFKLINEELKKYPNLSSIYGTPRPADDEWNIMIGDLWSGSYHKQFDTPWVAAHNITALINKIEQGLVLSLPVNGLFNGDNIGGCHDFPLIDCSGNKKPAYYAFKGFNWLADTNRLSTTGTDQMNFAAITGKSKDNNIIVVISNFDVQAYLDTYVEKTIPSCDTPSWGEYNYYVSKFGQPKIYNKFNLTLNNLPWTSSQQIVYERYLVDDNHKLDLTEIKTLTGNNTISLSADMTAPSVQVIKMYLKK